MVAAGGQVGGGHALEGSLLDGHVGVEVGRGRSDVGVAEPERDHCRVDAAVEQVHGAGVPEDVRVDLIGMDRRVQRCGGPGVLSDETLDGVGTEPPPGPGREGGVVG